MGNSGHSVVRTPNLDRLAEKKLIPLTTPTATARYPCLLDDLPKWHRSSGRPPARSPNKRRNSNSHVTLAITLVPPTIGRQATDLALDFLKQESTSASKQPFLLYCGSMRPHFPLITIQTHSNCHRLGIVHWIISIRSFSTCVGPGEMKSLRLNPLFAVRWLAIMLWFLH